MLIDEIKNTLVSFKNEGRKVLKRNDDIVPFSKDKIVSAISKAFTASNESADTKTIDFIADKVIHIVNDKYSNRTITPIEDIQDIIEQVLMDENYKITAKQYILYRENRSRIRSNELAMIDINNTMDGYLNQSDWRVNENSIRPY